jgi:hypothetical protein
MELWDKIWQLLLLILSGAGIYFVALLLLGIRVSHFRASFSS